MNNSVDKNTFAQLYAGKAPWDIGRPQPAVVDIAERISGSILDAGCGTGSNALFFAQRNHEVTGIDFLEEPIRRAKQKAAAQGVAVNFLVLDALSLPELGKVFDNALDCGLFHGFADDDRQRYVAALATAIKPGGHLFLLCFSDQEPGTEGPRRVSQAELRAAFATGWTIESIAAFRFDVVSDYQPRFSPGGPKAWLAVIRRD